MYATVTPIERLGVRGGGEGMSQNIVQKRCKNKHLLNQLIKQLGKLERVLKKASHNSMKTGVYINYIPAAVQTVSGARSFHS